MIHDFDHLEEKRLALQARLDAGKPPAERNKLGQFATPPKLARHMLRYAFELLPSGERIRFLDPAFGAGAFYSALRRVFPDDRIASALGFEIDRDCGQRTEKLWRGTGLELRIADFTREEAKSEFNLVICNPPYVRHHHIENGEKARLKRKTVAACDFEIGGLAGLYCHFLGQAHAWMTDGAIAGWLVPSEFMDVNYGRAVKRYLLEAVTLLHIHRFDPAEVQFADALVSSALVWIRKTPPPRGHKVRFTFGGTLFQPRFSKMISATALTEEPKWTRFPMSEVRATHDAPTVGDLFKIKRGIATGHNGYFILDEREISRRRLPKRFFRPILPSPRYVPDDVIESDEQGNPVLDRPLFLMDCRLPKEAIKERYPTLWTYLEEGKAQGIHERYLCRHRTPWYIQEDRPPAPIICTYLARPDAETGRAFRFILNNSQATIPNVYLALYPTAVLQRAAARQPGLIRRAWEGLNRVSAEDLVGEGRVYGGGLHKLEPKELANVPILELADLAGPLPALRDQGDLFSAVAADQ